MDNNPYMQLPGITVEELGILQQATVGLTEVQQQHFFRIYAEKRKSPQDVLMYCALAIVIPGLQRFMLGQIGWAVLYFFTGGLFFVMTVMDLVYYKKLTLEYDQQMAFESYQLAKMMN
jgi:TM2 domain-containing membrane protein YozV